MLLPGREIGITEEQSAGCSGSAVFGFRRIASRVYFLQLGGTVVFGLETNFGCLFQISTFVLSQIEHNFSLESGHSRNNV